MAETSFSRLDHRAPIARASVNAPLDLDNANRTVRDDGATYHPLQAPTDKPPGFVAFPPPSPPVPTEQELRDRLRAALEAEHEAEDRAALAKSAHDRATAYLHQCDEALKAYADLDSEISASVIQQLIDGDQTRIAVPPALDERGAERDRARVAYTAGVRASEALAHDLATASKAATAAEQKVSELVANLLAFSALAVAERHERLLAEAAAFAELCHSFDHFVANRRVTLPAKVRGVLANDQAAFARRRDQSAW